MFFGYDSAFVFRKSLARIEDKAVKRLNHFNIKRSSTKPWNLLKPIISICYSLVKIRVHKAINFLHESDSDLDYKYILNTNRDITFMDVPYQGSDSPCWVSFDTTWLKNASLSIPINIAFVSNLMKFFSYLSKCF